MSTGSAVNEPSLEYVHYVKSISKVHPKYGPFHRWLQNQPRIHSRTDNPFVYIVDSVDRSLKFYRHLGHGGNAEEGLGKLKSAIQNPPREVRTRLLVVDIRKQHLSPDLIDTIGVTYDIEPAYFASIAAKHIHPSQNAEGPNQVTEIQQSVGSFLHLDLIQTPPYPDNHQHLWVKQFQQRTPENRDLNIGKLYNSGTGFSN